MKVATRRFRRQRQDPAVVRLARQARIPSREGAPFPRQREAIQNVSCAFHPPLNRIECSIKQLRKMRINRVGHRRDDELDLVGG